MKKCFLILLLLAIPSIVFAQGSPVVVFSEGQYATTFAVICSSSTATEIRPANVKRLELSLFNPEVGSYVYISTYAATSTSALYPIATSSGTSVFGVNPYTGAVYGLSGKNNATITVRGWETTR